MDDVMLSDDAAAAAVGGDADDPGSGEGTTPEHPHLAESFDAESVLALLAYEETHAKRVALVQALQERLAAVRNGTEPSGPLGEYLPRPHPFAE